jgi:zinc/manganese transport system substrate-binding protein/zinc transport system substrate-binding protein
MKQLIGLTLGLGLGIGFAQSESLPVAATTGFIGDMVKNVGGGRVALTVIAPPTADPHSFEPKPSALVGVSKARAVFGNGLGLEPFFAKVAAQAPKNALRVLLAEGQPGLIKTSEGLPDPHLWLDPSYGVRYVERISDTLSRLDPTGKAVYETNAARYIEAIQRADAGVLACLAKVSRQNRKIISQHEALAYFSRHYGLTIVGGIADFAGQEKGPRHFANLAQTMKAQNIKTIFAEPQFPKNEARALAEATGAKVGLIYSDAFDDTVNTYLKLLAANGKAVCASFQ